jgi:hypothetical protein
MDAAQKLAHTYEEDTMFPGLEISPLLKSVGEDVNIVLVGLEGLVELVLPQPPIKCVVLQALCVVFIGIIC